MKITPLDIRQKTFESKFRGYDKDEVKAFLNSLSHEWERVQDDYKEMKIRYDAIQKEVEKLRQVESSLYRTLKTAEDTGANLIDQANRAAELQLREAQMKAEETVKTAREKAKFIVEDAEKTARTILEEMKDAITDVESDFHRLESIKDSLLIELKNLSSDLLEKAEKHKTQKERFDFDAHLKKARSLARLNKEHSYYGHELVKEEPSAPDYEHSPSPQTESLPEQSQEANQPEISEEASYETGDGQSNISETEPVQNDNENKQRKTFFDELE